MAFFNIQHGISTMRYPIYSVKFLAIQYDFNRREIYFTLQRLICDNHIFTYMTFFQGVIK